MCAASALPRKIRNFRELGGYPAAGKTVRRGVLYRSGTLTHASESDFARLAALGIRTIIDMRTVEEAQEHPSPAHGRTGFDLIHLPILSGTGSRVFTEVERRIRERDFASFDADSIMNEEYRNFITQWSQQFGEFLRILLARGGEPVLWHCSGGKDRTGFAAAIVLKILGVDETVIFSDYLESARHLPVSRARLALFGIVRGREAVNLLREVFTVRRAWLAEAFRAVDEHWGNFDRYRRLALGIEDAEAELLRSCCLE